ncbi:MAG: hypothetical protein IPO13_07085 [Rhodocyclaceae bacterium]|nr:hypothetical protein [Rhodocyclaceae bacterium]
MLPFLGLLELAIKLIDAILLRTFDDLMRLRSAVIMVCNLSGANIFSAS